MKQVLVHPKTYATVTERDGSYFLVRTNEGQELQLQIANKSGKKHHDDVQPGIRVKVDQRAGEDFLHYRLMGC